MKKISFLLFALFAGAAAQLSAQVNVNTLLNELSQAIDKDPANTAALVEEAVEANPAQVNQIVSRLLAEYPEQAEEIVFGAISGLPAPVSEDAVASLVQSAVKSRPALAPEIVLGARRATTGLDMREIIDTAAASSLLEVGARLVEIAGSKPKVVYNETLRISPSKNTKNN